MSGTFNRIALWLADNLHLSTMLLAGALVLLRLLKQPVRRLVVAKATIIAMFLLAILVALPGWSIIHLCIFEDHAPPPAAPTPSSSSSLAVPPPLITAQSATPENRASPTEIHRSSINLPALSWPQIIVGIYAVGAATVFAWLALGMFAATRLIRTSQPTPPELNRALASINLPPSQVAESPWRGGARGGSNRGRGAIARMEAEGGSLMRQNPDFVAALLTSPHIQVPVALGLTHPTIILPSSWLTDRTPNELRTILAHEQAHIQNGDLLWLAISRALLILMWPQPLYWLLRRQMRLDQESLADAAAADLTDRHVYAEHLVAWARALPRNTRPSLTAAVGLWESPSQLRRRIALLLNDRLTILRQCPRPWRLATTAIALVAAAALSPITLQPATQAEAHSVISSTTENPVSSDQPSAARPGAGADHLTPNTISGRITDASGQPLSGIDVRLYQFHFDRERRLVASHTTASDGRFRFDVAAETAQLFPNGSIPTPDDRQLNEPLFMLEARAPGLASWQHVELAADVARSGAESETALPTASSVRGRVTSPDGQPVAGALVAFDPGLPGWDGAHTVRTDASGRYIIDDVVAATYADGITIQHPDFAVKWEPCKQIPATVDVQLDLPAEITGRVVFADSQRPAQGVFVRLSGSGALSMDDSTDHAIFLLRDEYLHAPAITDDEGRYHFRQLPVSQYNICAEYADWFNPESRNIEARAGQATTAPDLLLNQGGTLRVRLVDSKNGRPIQINGNERVQFNIVFDEHVTRPPDSRPQTTDDGHGHITAASTSRGTHFGRWLGGSGANADAAGRFSFNVVPGKSRLVSVQVIVNKGATWTSDFDKTKGRDIEVGGGATLDIDVPVIQVPETPPAAVVPADKSAEPDKPSIEKSAIDNRPPSGATDPATDPQPQSSDTTSSQVQKAEARYKNSSELLATLANDGYRLEKGEPFKRRGPPYSKARDEFWALNSDPALLSVSGKDNGATPPEPGYMVLRWENGSLQPDTFFMHEPTFRAVLDDVFNVKLQDIQAGLTSLKTEVPGDWVVSWKSRGDHPTSADEVALLELDLRNELHLPFRLQSRDVQQTVYVVKGNYKLTPTAGADGAIRSLPAKIAERADGEFQIPLRRTNITGKVGTFRDFLQSIGEVILTPIVDEIDSRPTKRDFFWHYEGTPPKDLLTKFDERQVNDLLASISKQTGLTFTKESRPVRILFIERETE